MTETRPRMARGASLLGLGLALLWPAAAPAATDFSAAERALFVDNHLAAAQPPLTLHYSFRRTGSLEAPFTDSVDVELVARPDGRCCAASARFLSGANEVKQPGVDGVEGNPAILYFLERDIREMQRLTQGQANYFRKRVRMAIYQGASIRELKLPYRGRQVAVREIAIEPYVDDPNRPRFERLANKRYVFMLAPEVPGGLYGIRTRVEGPTPDAPALLVEEMLLDSSNSAPAQR